MKTSKDTVLKSKGSPQFSLDMIKAPTTIADRQEADYVSIYDSAHLEIIFNCLKIT